MLGLGSPLTQQQHPTRTPYAGERRDAFLQARAYFDLGEYLRAAWVLRPEAKGFSGRADAYGGGTGASWQAGLAIGMARGL